MLRKNLMLTTVVRMIGQRSGFLGRRHDGEPGARTICLGLQEIAIFIEGARVPTRIIGLALKVYP